MVDLETKRDKERKIREERGNSLDYLLPKLRNRGEREGVRIERGE